MNYRNDVWMVKKIFQLSDRALIRMVNRLFRTEYKDEEGILKEWSTEGPVSVRLTIGSTDRYEFRLRHLEGCLQIYAEDRGCIFHYEDAAAHSVVQIREPQIIYFGKDRKEEYFTTLEFPGNARVVLPIHMITLSDCSVQGLEKTGLIPFLPFLFYFFSADTGGVIRRQEALKKFVIHDIVGILHESLRKGDLTVFDVQKLKRLCWHMIWNFLLQEKWMQNPELQELLHETLETDLELLEKVHEMELQKIRNKCAES